MELLEWDPRDVDTLEEHYRRQGEKARVEQLKADVKAQRGA